MFRSKKKYILILILFGLGYFLVNYYRPFQNIHKFFDLGLADSASGMLSFMMVYFFLSQDKTNRREALELSLSILCLYLLQEILSYFFPGRIGTFDWKDLVYYSFAFIIIYFFDVKGRKTA
jgi:O-antigen ligase